MDGTYIASASGACSISGHHDTSRQVRPLPWTTTFAAGNPKRELDCVIEGRKLDHCSEVIIGFPVSIPGALIKR